MDLDTLLTELNDHTNEAGQLAAVEGLEALAGDDQVLDALCAVALRKTGATAKVREKIIDILKPRSRKAIERFINAARKHSDRSSRRLALVNLSLLGCESPDAREVALQGLQDPDPDIRHAAALCAGYFDDPLFLGALARYLDDNRFTVACAGIHRQIFRHRIAGREGKAERGVQQPSTSESPFKEGKEVHHDNLENS